MQDEGTYQAHKQRHPLRQPRVWLIIGIVVAFYSAFPVLMLLSGIQRSHSVPNKPSFCVEKNGNIVFTAKGEGGSDLYLYDRQTHQRRLIAGTPYFEDEPALSSDGRQIVCTFIDQRNWSSGLEIFDVATGTSRCFLVDRFAGDTRPVFSPSARHIVFTHYGSGLNSPLMSMARSYLCELDVSTGQVTDLVEQKEYVSIDTPLYLDEDHIAFLGSVDFNYGRDSKSVIGTYTRGRGIRNLDLPAETYIHKLLSFDRTANAIYSLVQSRQSDSHIAFMSRRNLLMPKKWHLTPIVCDDATYSPGTNEILMLAENVHSYTINATSLRTNKTTTVLTLPK